MTSRRILALNALAILVSAACGRGEVHPDGESPIMTPELALEIPASTPGGEVLFSAVVDATRLSSGVIVVADAASPTLAFFSPSGAPIRTSGRLGQGPGEYRALYALEQCGPDSLFVFDIALTRISVTDSSGQFVRQFGLPRPAAQFGCSRSGIIGLVLPPDEVPSAPEATAQARLLILNTAGDSLGGIRAIRVGQNRPMGALARIAVAGRAIVYGPADSAWIELYATDGTLRTRRPAGTAGRPASRHHYGRAIDLLMQGITDSVQRAIVRSRMLQVPMPEQLPAYTKLLATAEGQVAVVVSSPGDGETRIELHAAEREVSLELVIPDELDIVEVGPDYLLAIHGSDAGNQTVRLYRFRRGHPRTATSPAP